MIECVQHHAQQKPCYTYVESSAKLSRKIETNASIIIPTFSETVVTPSREGKSTGPPAPLQAVDITHWSNRLKPTKHSLPGRSAAPHTSILPDPQRLLPSMSKCGCQMYCETCCYCIAESLGPLMIAKLYILNIFSAENNRNAPVTQW